MQSEKNLYQADVQTVSLIKDMRENVHNICKEHVEKKVRIEAIDGQIFEGVIVDFDDQNVYVEVDDPDAEEDDYEFEEVASRKSHGDWGMYPDWTPYGYPYGGYQPFGDVSPLGSSSQPNRPPAGQVSPYADDCYPYAPISPFGSPNQPYGQVSPFGQPESAVWAGKPVRQSGSTVWAGKSVRQPESAVWAGKPVRQSGPAIWASKSVWQSELSVRPGESVWRGRSFRQPLFRLQSVHGAVPTVPALPASAVLPVPTAATTSGCSRLAEEKTPPSVPKRQKNHSARLVYAFDDRAALKPESIELPSLLPSAIPAARLVARFACPRL
ncbi:hypothetical protein [Brevibacillus sp. NSP2.1]|uniref:hypothetical protein n=1 Tax=Brevibacillus sp. NSP2.1 TaxID=3003229 RepID=UPI00256F6191|nr:hypothetical protein [Brevibacillus sp. NSP2.1]